MICPNREHKTKKYTLKTLRTIAQGMSVERNRICPKCKLRFTTYELFNTTIQEKESELRKEITEIEEKYCEIKAQLEKQNHALKIFKDLISNLEE